LLLKRRDRPGLAISRQSLVAGRISALIVDAIGHIAPAFIEGDVAMVNRDTLPAFAALCPVGRAVLASNAEYLCVLFLFTPASAFGPRIASAKLPLVMHVVGVRPGV
jgi:hypothetical protein